MDIFLDQALRKTVKGVFSHLKSFTDQLYVNCFLKSDVAHDEIKGFVFIHSTRALKKPKQILLITTKVVVITTEVVVMIKILIIMNNYLIMMVTIIMTNNSLLQ